MGLTTAGRSPIDSSLTRASQFRPRLDGPRVGTSTTGRSVPVRHTNHRVRQTDGPKTNVRDMERRMERLKAEQRNLAGIPKLGKRC